MVRDGAGSSTSQSEFTGLLIFKGNVVVETLPINCLVALL